MSGPIFIKTQSEKRLLAGRGFFWRLIAELTRHPHVRGQFLQRVRRESEEALGYLDGTTATALKKILDPLFDALDRSVMDERTGDYEHTFGHTAHSRVPAYELEYGEEHSHRQPQELGDIAAFYRAFGLEPSQTAHEREDHISVECEFMYVLLFKELYALVAGDEEKASCARDSSRRFLSEHPAVWLPAFGARLEQSAQSVLLVQTGRLIRTFASEECRLANVAPGLSTLPIRMIQEKIETGCVSCQYGPAAAAQEEAR